MPLMRIAVSGLIILLAMCNVSLIEPARAQDKEKTSNTDRYGDSLPGGAVARIGTTRLRHAAYVSSLAFSPDSKRISSATIWFDVGVWDACTGQSLAFRSSPGRRSEPG